MHIISESYSHILSSVVHEVFDACEVEAHGEPHGLVKRIGGCQADAVGDIQREDGEVEACTDGQLVAVTFVEVLVTITEAGEELLVVGVLQTCAPAHFIKLLFGSARCVSERLEDTFYGR